MTIDADLRLVARDFGLPDRVIRFAQAVIEAEGGGDHIITAVRLSVPTVKTREDALRILCRSIVHRMCDFCISTDLRLYGFTPYFASFWAPVGVANDPTHLNENFVTNVSRFLSEAEDA